VADPHELEILPDAEAAALRGAEVIAEVARPGGLTIAVSGGRSPWAMLARLGALGLTWTGSGIWQVDERVALDGDPDRNLTGLLANLPPEARAVVRPMPVTDDDLETAAVRYAGGLPERFDVVHLGLGDDGHTASLVPDDPVLQVSDRDVAVTAEYRGRRRMTFTYPLLDRVPFVLWLVAGKDKASVLPLLLASDASIPAGRVRAARQLVLADRAAAAELG
jgi:6-phosphogluconolactonase/glucosamine-6-phosphate isomerase/deaminase